MLQTLEAVLFDLDGTLIETHIDFPEMTQAMLALASSHHIPDEVVSGKDILGIVDAAAHVLSERGEPAEDFRRSAFAQLEALEITGCSHPILLPAVHELFDTLHTHNIHIGIVTRNCRTVSTSLLSRFSVPYDILLTRDDVRLTKPNPQHLWSALNAMNVPVEYSMMVGDHWMDIRAGRDAGCLWTVGVLGTHDESHFFPCPPDYLFRDLSELLSLVQSTPPSQSSGPWQKNP